jgi:hypothetical protein
MKGFLNIFSGYVRSTSQAPLTAVVRIPCELVVPSTHLVGGRAKYGLSTCRGGSKCFNVFTKTQNSYGTVFSKSEILSAILVRGNAQKLQKKTPKITCQTKIGDLINKSDF